MSAGNHATTNPTSLDVHDLRLPVRTIPPPLDQHPRRRLSPHPHVTVTVTLGAGEPVGAEAARRGGAASHGVLEHVFDPGWPIHAITSRLSKAGVIDKVGHGEYRIHTDPPPPSVEFTPAEAAEQASLGDLSIQGNSE